MNASMALPQIKSYGSQPLHAKLAIAYVDDDIYHDACTWHEDFGQTIICTWHNDLPTLCAIHQKKFGHKFSIITWACKQQSGRHSFKWAKFMNSEDSYCICMTNQSPHGNRTRRRSPSSNKRWIVLPKPVPRFINLQETIDLNMGLSNW